MKKVLLAVAAVAAMSTAVAANPFVHAADDCAVSVDGQLLDRTCVIFALEAIDANARQEGRGSAFSEVAEAIAAHNPNDAQRFASEGKGFIDALYGYIFHLRGQLGLD